MSEYEWRPVVVVHGTRRGPEKWFRLGNFAYRSLAEGEATRLLNLWMDRQLEEILVRLDVLFNVEVREVRDPEVEAVAHVISPDTMPGEWSRSKARAAIAALDSIYGLRLIMPEYEWRAVIVQGDAEPSVEAATGWLASDVLSQGVLQQEREDSVPVWLLDLLEEAGLRLEVETREVLDPELEAVALALVNARNVRAGLNPFESLAALDDRDKSTSNSSALRLDARAAIAALDSIRGESKPAVVIEPREGVPADALADWLEQEAAAFRIDVGPISGAKITLREPRHAG